MTTTNVECASNTFSGLHVWRDSAVGKVCKFCHARERAVVGQERAYNASPDEWKERAQDELNSLIRGGWDFTSEDITAVVGKPAGVTETNRNNAVGGLMGRASRQGLIRKVGHRPSRNPRSNAATLVVWRGVQR